MYILATPCKQSLIQLHFHLWHYIIYSLFICLIRLAISFVLVRCMLDYCWPWGSHAEQANHCHCFMPERQASERSWVGGCICLKGPRSESFCDSSGVTIWIWRKPRNQGSPASCWVPALLPVQGHWSHREKRCKSPLCKKGRLLTSSIGV